MKIRFFGATEQVTGSMFLLEAGGRRVLVECGLVQGNAREEEVNSKPFPFRAADLDAVVLTHAHLDHTGRIPLLVKDGFAGPVYTHFATRDLCEILLQDAAYINEKEAEWNNRKRQRKGLSMVEALYSRDQATQAMANFQPLNYHEPNEILPGIVLTLHDAGHILGSAIAEFRLKEQGHSRTVVFSGDLGHRGAPILRDPKTLRYADLVVMEGTYGDRLHRPWEETWQEMNDILNQSNNGSGNILIPSFAVGRTQELLFGLARYFDDWNLQNWTIFLDSPLAIKATEIYKKYFHLYDSETLALWRDQRHPFMLPNFHVSESAEQSMALNTVRSGAIIIAGSGMCDGGRIKHHLKHNVWRSNCRVLMVGFQARGTLGRQLVDGARHIRLWGETIKVNASIHTVGGFSAHADRHGLCAWYGAFDNHPQLALVHGEPQALGVLQSAIHEAYGIRPHIPAYASTFDLLKMKPQA